MTEKPWSGRFDSDIKKEVLDYSVGDDIDLDKELIIHDIIGTEAHDIMLYKVGILKEQTIKNILTGLERIKKLVLENKFILEKNFEDVHMNIEKAVINYIGEDDGGNIHIARSRNDQIQLDLRLFMRDNIIEILEQLINLIESLINKAKSNLDTIMPGYTHFQLAQPITFAHWSMSHVDAFIRDFESINTVYKQINQSPLGAAAMAGVSWKIDRKLTADLLGFDSVQENTLDCISCRGEFIAKLLSSFSILMIHLSKISEDFILWSTREFNMVEINDSFATGSSIMPQKKNPDICELIRARTTVLNSLLFQVLNIIKGLPSGYHRDHQETKYPLIKSIKIVKESISIMTGLINTIILKKDRMNELVNNNFIAATEVMDYLVKHGIPLRTAHNIVGKFIKGLIKNSVYSLNQAKVEILKNLVKNELQIDLKITQKEFDDLINIENIIKNRNLIGGPAPEEVSRMIKDRTDKIQIYKKINEQIKNKNKTTKLKLNELVKSIINGGK
ncbi:MAG: argininosuccinate lyase [Candidatus Helarchaeota archaeon]